MRPRWLAMESAVALLIGVASGFAALAAPVPSRLELGVTRALEHALPADGLPVAIALAPDSDRAGSPRAEAIRAAQERVLFALPPGSFRTKHRYAQIAGLAGWAQRAALEALAAHPEVALVHLDARVSRVLRRVSRSWEASPRAISSSPAQASPRR